MEILISPQSVGGGSCDCNVGSLCIGQCVGYNSCIRQSCIDNECIANACQTHCWGKLCNPRMDPNFTGTDN